MARQSSDVNESSFSSFSIELVESEESEEEFFSDILPDDTIIIHDVEDNQNQNNDDDQLSEITSMMKISSTTSPVWKFFTRKEKTIENQSREEQIVKYIHCNVGECQLSGTNSTSTLERHLKARHKDVYARLYEQAEDIELWTNEEQKEKHIFLLNWVVVDQQSFALVENQSFQKFISIIQPRYKLPSRHTLKEMILSKFKTAREKIIDYLQLSSSKISFTIDMWTSISALGILAITIHFINENWQLKHFILDILYIPSSHNALSIKNAVLEIANQFKVANRLIGITSDNESKMIASIRLIKEDLESSVFQHYRCAAHILNLVVGAALEANTIPNSIKKLRNFVSIIRNSSKQMDKLKEYFRIDNVDFKTPLPDITTRWNYTYFMIERALEIKSFLAHLTSNLSTLTENWPTESEWKILEDLLELLAPFAMITKVISASSYPTIGEVKWLFLGIKYHLENFENHTLQIQINAMKRVFNNYFEQFNKSLHIPAFFDPRYKQIIYENMTREEIFQPIQSAMANYTSESITTSVSRNTTFTMQRQLATLSTSETRNYFRNIFMSTHHSSQIQQPTANELDLYFNSHSPSDEIMPLDWWKIHATEYPVLARMAQDYLCIMSTSVPCEQVFSVAGKQITQTRNRMHPNTAQACLCLKSWLEQKKIE